MPKGPIDCLNEKSNFPHLQIDIFLLMTLTRNSKEKDFILHVENRLLVGFFRHQEAAVHFPELNSFFRMLVHRVTRYYGFQRVADPVGRTVTVFKPSADYVRPALKLSELVEPSLNTPPAVESLRGGETASTIMPRSKVTIMRRDRGEGQDSNSAEIKPKQTKTLEEREKEYEEARNRIFTAAEEERAQEAEEDCFNLNDDSLHTSPEAIQDEANIVEERIQFEGWKNLEKITPFIPSSISQSSILPPDEEDLGLDLSKLWIPRHIFVIRDLQGENEQNQKLKGQCRRNYCKLHRPDGTDAGLLAFSYKVGLTEVELSTKFGHKIELWRPFFLPEPPN